jgi:hypothetical protein
MVWVGPSGATTLERELAAFRARLRAMGPYRYGSTHPPEDRDVSYRVG